MSKLGENAGRMQGAERFHKPGKGHTSVEILQTITNS